NDHRGHGHTGERADSMGYLADQDGFERLVDDLRAVHEWACRRWPGAPRFLMGHSMGSFLVRRYIQRYGDTVAGVIIMGTAGNPGLLGKIGRRLARLEMPRRGPRHPRQLPVSHGFGRLHPKLRTPD